MDYRLFSIGGIIINAGLSGVNASLGNYGTAVFCGIVAIACAIWSIEK